MPRWLSRLQDSSRIVQCTRGIAHCIERVTIDSGHLDTRMADEFSTSDTMTLRVTRKDEIARGIDLFELRRPDGGELPPFTAGAHVSIKVPNGLIRKYSLCNDPAERDRYQIAVKREDSRPRRLDQPDRKREGRRRIDRRAAGQRFRAGAQRAGFHVHRRRHRHHADHVDDAHRCNAIPGKQFKLYYCTRSPEFTAFRDELRRAGIRGQGDHPSRRRRSRRARSTSGRSSRSARTARISIAAARAR